MSVSPLPACYLCLDLKDWPIQRLQRERPEFRERIVVVTATDRRRRAYAAACCVRAAEAGIRPGMPMAEAVSLLQPSAQAGPLPRLHLQPLDEEADRASLERLGGTLYRFTSWVGYPAEGLPHSLFLELHRTAPLWGGVQELADTIARAVYEEGYRAALAGAASPSAAWALARFAAQVGERPQIVAGHALRQVLGALPVEALRVKPSTLELLGWLGLVRLEQLWQLPRSALPSRFGDDLLRRLDQLLGEQPEIVPPCPRPQPSCVEREIEPPTERQECLQRVLQEGLQELIAQLRAQGQGLMVLDVGLVGAEGERLGFQVGVYRPTADEGLWEKLIQLRLESLAVSSPVRQVHLEAALEVRLESCQELLWPSGPAAGHREQMETLVNRLSSRLGGQRVVRPAWQGGIVPERACRWVAWIGRHPRQALPPFPGGDVPPRPLWLCQPPQPIRVEILGPDERPVGLWEGGRKRVIRRAWGPERLETGWWRGASQQRDYYRIELEDGRQWWLFCRRTDRKWFLHGYFG